MRRSLIYYWRVNLAVMLGAALATAVLTGALLVGDSVRGSLRDLALDRLGNIDYVLGLNRFVRDDLAADFIGDGLFQIQFEKPSPAILSIASITNATTKARAAGVNILGIDQRFIDFFLQDSTASFASLSAKNSNQIFPSLIINEALRKELDAKPGDDVLIALQRHSDIHRETLLGSKKTVDLVKTARFTISNVVPDRGIGRFGLRPNQSLPLNAYASLTDLQKALDQRGKANHFFFARKEKSAVDSAAALLTQILQKKITLDDYGIKLCRNERSVSIESSEIILDPQIVEIVENANKEAGIKPLRVLSYLANTMQVKDRVLPYSTISAIEIAPDLLSQKMSFVGGSPAFAIEENEILLNEWAAKDLMAIIGDTVKLSYYVVGEREQLLTRQAEFRLAGVVAMAGLGADPTLTPEFPGIHDAEDMQSWDPPFPVDLNHIRPKDEDYWDRYRASPKAFIPISSGQKLWSSRFGNLTSIRLDIPQSSDAKAFTQELQSRLLRKLVPAKMGFVFRDVKQSALEAASGATNFSMLFIGFSLFIIVAAGLLIGMLFRLGVEQRAKEIGTLLAVGFSVREVNKRLLGEGILLAGVGCAIGLFGAIGYAGLMITGLRTWWVNAIGSPFLFLHVNVLSLIIGYFAAVLVTLGSIWLAIRRMSKIPASALLHGITAADKASPAKWSKVIAAFSISSALILVAGAIGASATSSAELFFVIGALFLVGGLSLLSLRFRKLRTHISANAGFAGTLQMSIDYSARNPGRSMLSAGLVCCAIFIIVAVAASRKTFDEDSLAKNSGTGGFSLVAQSNIPLHHDLNTKTNLAELGFAEDDIDPLANARFLPMRMLPGEDASCLNLYQPQQPSILGATQEHINRGGFSFQSLLDPSESEKENPWELLQKEIAPDIVPAFGDYNSVQWIMHIGLGKDLAVQDEHGKEIKLRFVGLLTSSIFQSEVIISEENFLKHFPSAAGYSYFLIDAPAARQAEITSMLEDRLKEFGFDATSTRDKLAAFQAVENTYLSVFQTLGGLGLLLGTVGLGIVLVRNVIERRGELATLRAFGFQRSTLTFMLLAENVLLILAGLSIGTVSALLAVAPHLTAGSAPVPWLSLALTLLSVLIVGLAASAVSATAALRIPLLPALKAE
jgi:ABC-type antimicrobial peptide transport system permease subunit